MIGGKMAGSELAPMVERILISLSGLQILTDITAFRESLKVWMEKPQLFWFKDILVCQMIYAIDYDCHVIAAIIQKKYILSTLIYSIQY
jgi:hypothetical protein